MSSARAGVVVKKLDKKSLLLQASFHVVLRSRQQHAPDYVISSAGPVS